MKPLGSVFSFSKRWHYAHMATICSITGEKVNYVGLHSRMSYRNTSSVFVVPGVHDQSCSLQDGKRLRPDDHTSLGF